MIKALPDLKAGILERIRAAVARKVWTPSDFFDLGSRAAIDKALQRLTKAGTLRRIDRGLYDQPGFNKLTQRPTPPDPRSVIDAVGRRDQTRMLVDGMAAANDLGLTDAVPAKIVVHTETRRRPIKLGNVTITFRLTAPRKLFWAGRPAMRVVQALHWLHDVLKREGERDQVRRKLANLFEDPAGGLILKADLISGMATLPAWALEFLKPLLVDTGDRDRRRHVDDDSDLDPEVLDNAHHNPMTDGKADQDRRKAARSRPKPSSSGKKRPAKRGPTREAKA